MDKLLDTFHKWYEQYYGSIPKEPDQNSREDDFDRYNLYEVSLASWMAGYKSALTNK